MRIDMRTIWASGLGSAFAAQKPGKLNGGRGGRGVVAAPIEPPVLPPPTAERPADPPSSGAAANANNGDAGSSSSSSNAGGNSNANGNGNAGENGNAGSSPKASGGTVIVTWTPPGLVRGVVNAAGSVAAIDPSPAPSASPPGPAQVAEPRPLAFVDLRGKSDASARTPHASVPDVFGPRGRVSLSGVAGLQVMQQQMREVAAKYAAMSALTQITAARNERSIVASRPWLAPPQPFFGSLRIRQDLTAPARTLGTLNETARESPLSATKEPSNPWALKSATT